MKPLIGITSNYIDDDKIFMDKGMGGRGQLWSAVANDYADAVYAAGGIPVLLPVTEDEDFNRELVERLDGIIFSGGADIDPSLANMRSTSKVGRIYPERDSQEMFLMDYIYKNTNMPMLCICRGIQFLNIYLGGDVILDIPTAGYPDHALSSNKAYFPAHEINLEEGSLAHEIYGETKIYVNSLHHQAAGKPGKYLNVTGRSDDGIIEILEHDDIRKRFIMGVQWHPEMMFEKYGDQLKIFDYFINEAGKIG